MKKDLVIAVLVGIVLGGFLAIGISNLPNILKKSPSKETAVTTPSPTITISATNNNELIVESPESEKVEEKKKTTIVKGKTKPGNLVMITTENESQVVESDGNGNFLQRITLFEGLNTILISSFDENGTGSTKTLTVYWTAENL